jgi:AcrR family transcriptional regulator
VPRTKLRTADLKSRLLASAIATLEAEGVAGLTTRRVASGASTSTPAVYELFGDRAGLVRELFFEGFRRLAEWLGEAAQSADQVEDLVRLVEAYRAFALANPGLAEIMFARPFADFDPGPDEALAGREARRTVLDCVRRCTEAGAIEGDREDVAHVLLALAQGLAAQESAGWLGSSVASRDRRWRLGVRALLAGFAPR